MMEPFQHFFKVLFHKLTKLQMRALRPPSIKLKAKISINDAWNQLHMVLMLIVELKALQKLD